MRPHNTKPLENRKNHEGERLTSSRAGAKWGVVWNRRTSRFIRGNRWFSHWVATSISVRGHSTEAHATTSSISAVLPTSRPSQCTLRRA